MPTDSDSGQTQWLNHGKTGATGLKLAPHRKPHTMCIVGTTHSYVKYKSCVLVGFGHIHVPRTECTNCHVYIMGTVMTTSLAPVHCASLPSVWRSLSPWVSLHTCQSGPDCHGASEWAYHSYSLQRQGPARGKDKTAGATIQRSYPMYIH